MSCAGAIGYAQANMENYGLDIGMVFPQLMALSSILVIMPKEVTHACVKIRPASVT